MVDKLICVIGTAAASASLLAGIIGFVIYRLRLSGLMLRLNSEYGERKSGKKA